ncbi:MAG TPA: hypothetical protein ENI92_03870, partial [Bacteroidetes bacterium]|nr:hypothetical protein [Bacteroidota bacterium]
MPGGRERKPPFTPGRDSTPSQRLAVGLLSAELLALQLVFMRWYAVASWHHHAYLVVSAALLGLGASGSLLALFRRPLSSWFPGSASAAAALFALGAPAGLLLADALPVEAQYIAYDIRQVGLLLLSHLCVMIPFLFGGAALGLSLIGFSDTGRVYGASLLGSGAGAALGALLLNLLPPGPAVLLLAGLGMANAPLYGARAPGGRTGRFGAVLLSLCVLPGALGVFLGAAGVHWSPRIDPYKELAVLRRWAAQGDATFLATRHSARARLDLVRSPRLHRTLFAGLGAVQMPPPQDALLVDGHYAGPVLRIRTPDEASILDDTPQSLAYRLVRRPRVLLLGEAGGANVWLARRFGATEITIVQPDRNILEMIRALGPGDGGAALEGNDLEVVVMEPRRFLETSRRRFDIIQVSAAEGMAAGESGLLALRTTPLLTREALARCRRLLSPRGVLSITRGLQAPPRDNPKLLLTAADAWRAEGADPARRLLQAHNYLAAVTLAFRGPPADSLRPRIEAALEQLGLKLDTAPWSLHKAGALNGGDLLSMGTDALGPLARGLLSTARDSLVAGYLYDLRPARDGRPYAYHSFRWRSLPD